jgi:hypothetical protein
MHSLALIIFVVSEKKAFEYFPTGSNVNLCPAVAAILEFQMHKNRKIVEDLPMILPGQFGFNCPSGFRADIQHGCQGQYYALIV